MTTTSNQQAELEKASIRVVYFVELSFVSGTQRFCSAMQTITWGGHDWLGLGQILNIGAVEELGDTTPRALDFTLNIAQSSLLALAIGDVQDYRGRLAKLYMCPLDDQFRIVDTPILCWTGRMQTIAIGCDGEEGQIILNCETSAYDLKRPPGLRLNSAQHKRNHPTDIGLEYLEDLEKNPQTWLSKRFQAV